MKEPARKEGNEGQEEPQQSSRNSTICHKILKGCLAIFAVLVILLNYISFVGIYHDPNPPLFPAGMVNLSKFNPVHRNGAPYRITVLARGGRGNIQPYLALGKELAKSDRVTFEVVCRSKYADLFREQGIKVIPFDDEFEDQFGKGVAKSIGERFEMLGLFIDMISFDVDLYYNLTKVFSPLSLFTFLFSFMDLTSFP